MADADQFLDGYLEHLDGDYTIEHQEGTNRDRIASPEEIAELVKLQREKEAIQNRQANGGMYRQIVD